MNSHEEITIEEKYLYFHAYMHFTNIATRIYINISGSRDIMPLRFCVIWPNSYKSLGSGVTIDCIH